MISVLFDRNGNVGPLSAVLNRELNNLLRAYATLFFVDRAFIGALFLLATFVYPNIGICGLLAVVVATVFGGALKLTGLDGGLHLYNSLLVGLSLGAVYQLNLQLLLLIVLGAMMAVLLSSVLTSLAWRLGHLPALSSPFLLVALCLAFAAQGYSSLSRYLEPQGYFSGFWPTGLEDFFIALGSAFFSPHPYSGVLIFLGVLVCSRYLAFLAVVGYTVGSLCLLYLQDSPHLVLNNWVGFNFILSTMAVGGVFTVPGKASFLLALLTAALSALITTATQTAMLVHGLPVMAVPFLLSTFLVLMALRYRRSNSSPQLIVESPALPEISLERQRLANSRGLNLHSVALNSPVQGSWQIYQGINGSHTHRGPWRYALDFYRTQEDRSYRGDGHKLADYYCFSEPVQSPAYGQVIALEAAVADNPPGDVNVTENWGNYLLLQMSDGHYVLLAHLQQHSLRVVAGQWVVAGQPLARCGNSGRSPQPHLHLHVQSGPVLGSETFPFHLSHVLTQSPLPEQPRSLHLNLVPDETDTVTTAVVNSALQQCLNLPVGRILRYRYQTEQQGWVLGEFTVKLTLLGEFRLHSDSGASIAFSATHQLLAFYDRQGPSDQLLDGWVLAMGLTPICSESICWQDGPPAKFWPMNGWQRGAMAIFHPLGLALSSQYERHATYQSSEQEPNGWQQSGQHSLSFLPGLQRQLSSEAMLVAGQGCVSFNLYRLAAGGGRQTLLCAHLLSVAQLADNGIPDQISLPSSSISNETFRYES